MPLVNFDAVQVDAVRGEPVKADSPVAGYLKGAFEVRPKDAVTRLKYFFEYLDSADPVVSTDALNEFAVTDYADVRKVAPGLPAAKVLKWLADPATSRSRIGLYGLIVGHCGTKADAAALAKLITDPDNKFISGLDGLLVGYTLLDPAAGYADILRRATAPGLDFQQRYPALKALRFFWEYRPDVLDRAKILAGMTGLMADPAIADMPVEVLRQWGVWELTDAVVGLKDKPDHMAVPITRRAVLRFALAAPAGYKAAQAFVAAARSADPDRVKFVEQSLADEKPAAKTLPDPAKAVAAGPVPPPPAPAGGPKP